MEVTTRNARLILNAVKITPIITSLGMFAIVSMLLINGHDNAITETLRGICAFSTAGTIILIISSYYLHLCTVHRLFIIYTEFVSDACAFEDAIGFGEYLIYFRLIALIMGMALFIHLITHLNKFYNDGKQRRKQGGARLVCKRSA